jgi:uncharacterized protein YndB with AHSA1/START domain
VPTARRSRTIAAPAEQLWELVCDPHHLPRWWPRVTRVEGVRGGAFTEVMRTRKGKVVRADFDIVRKDDGERLLTWAQRVQGTPFASVLSAAETDVQLTPVAVKGKGTDSSGTQSGATTVTLELRQTLAGFSTKRGVLTGLSPRFGGRMVRRAAERTLGEALDGLEQISG